MSLSGSSIISGSRYSRMNLRQLSTKRLEAKNVAFGGALSRAAGRLSL